ncbi:hypothetical protein IMSHALPRED_002227 [Imshaugia aleurites]|uniref:Aminotransferase class I/classII large domain-containing protein n=1 Tax=Imshaugia aleurites TaxID=172621 RepID=A0A8H3PIB5_9LECA|nr:hypothetical protein IMSHALPRED_002227 [Imshaugia aleurites]
MDTPSSDAACTLSQRGHTHATAAKKDLQEVINNLWDAVDNPDGFALMHEEMADYVKDSIQALRTHAFTYGDSFYGSKRLRSAIAQFLNRYFHPHKDVKQEHVVTTAGLVNCLEQMAFALGDRGDGFLIGRPYYTALPSDFGSRAGVRALGVAFGDVDPFSMDAISKYEEALYQAQKGGIPTKALFLCSPQNPLGRCYPREVLVGLMKFCQRHQIHLISDEIYAISVWQNAEAPDAITFDSVLSIDTTGIIDPGLVHALWGISKDFGANGLRIGCIVSQHNNPLLEAVKANSLFTYPPSISDQITSTLLEDTSYTETYIRTNQLRLADNYAFAASFLKQHHIPYSSKVNAAFFLWVDLKPLFSKVATEEERKKQGKDLSGAIMQRLMAKKVFIANGEAFATEEPGWFRVVFSQPRAYVAEGLKRMVTAFEFEAE